jgi:hypothetical protein
MTFMNWMVPPMGMAPITHAEVLLPKSDRPTLPVVAFGMDRFARTVPRFFVYAPTLPEGMGFSDFEAAILAVKHSQTWYGPAPSFIVEYATNHVWAFNTTEE